MSRAVNSGTVAHVNGQEVIGQRFPSGKPLYSLAGRPQPVGDVPEPGQRCVI